MLTLSLQDHPLFTYTTEIDELMRRYHTNQTRQTSYDKQVQKAKEAEQDLLYIADQGRSFLEQHPEQCECPLCHTRFESWNLLYGATLKLESSQKKQLKEEARQIQQETASINAAYLRIRQRWLSMRENLLKKEDEICAQIDNAFLAAEQNRKGVEEQIKALEQEEQNIYLNAAELGWDWKQPLTVKEAENTLLEQNKDWKKKESDVYAQKELLEQHQKNLQLEKQNAECTVDKLKTWRAGIEKDPLWGKSVTYLREQSLDFDWNKRLHSLLLQSAEENSKIGDLQEKMNQITEISHSSIEALNTARTRAQKALQNQQKIFSEIAALVEKPEPRIEDLKQAREICVFEQEQKQTQISKLGNVIYSEGVSESIRKYNEYKTKIESLEHKIVTRKQALQKAQEALEAEKKTLLAELQKYFQQPLFNEIYQKIDPHPIHEKSQL